MSIGVNRVQVRLTCLSVVLIGGLVFSFLYLSHPLLIAPAVIIVGWFVNSVISQIYAKRPIFKLITQPFSRHSQEAFFSKGIVDSHYEYYGKPFALCPFGNITTAFVALNLYLVLCGILDFFAHPVLLIWLSLINPIASWFASLFPAWRGVYEFWHDAGIPHLAVVRMHFFFVGIISSIGFLIYQAIDVSKNHIFTDKNETKIRKHLKTVRIKDKIIMFLFGIISFIISSYVGATEFAETTAKSFLMHTDYIHLNIYFLVSFYFISLLTAINGIWFLFFLYFVSVAKFSSDG